MRTKKTCIILVLAFLPIIPPVILIHTLGGTGTNHALQVIQTSPGPNATFQYIVAILMENKNLGDIIGNSCCPYLNSLANDSGLAKNYFDVSNLGSLPNYMGLVAANTLSTWSTCNSTPLQCNGWPSGGDTDPTILDTIESAGLTWKAYMENYPGSGSGSNYSTGGCFLSDSGNYVARHDPFVWFSHIINNSTECSKIINSGTNGATLISDLGSNFTASRFMWLTPNLCNDSTTCTASVGDTYLSQIVPQILNSPVFKTNRAALYITWDEGSNSGHVPALWAGSAAKNNYTSILSYNHFSLLKTIESVWDLTSLTASDGGASPMTEFFKAEFTITTSTSVLTAPIGTNLTSTLTLTSLFGYSGNISLGVTVQSPITIGGNGGGGHPPMRMAPLSLLPTSSITPVSLFLHSGQSSQCNLTIILPLGVPAGNYTLTVQAISGTLSRTLYINISVPSSGLTTILTKIFTSNGTILIGVLAFTTLLASFSIYITRTPYLKNPKTSFRTRRFRGTTQTPRHSYPRLKPICLGPFWTIVTEPF